MKLLVCRDTPNLGLFISVNKFVANFKFRALNFWEISCLILYLPYEVSHKHGHLPYSAIHAYTAMPF